MISGDTAFIFCLFIGAPLGLLLGTMYLDWTSPRHLRVWWFRGCNLKVDR
jgi:hypothetical protein